MDKMFKLSYQETFELGVLEGEKHLLLELIQLLNDRECRLEFIRMYIRARYSSLKPLRTLSQFLAATSLKEMSLDRLTDEED